MTEETPARNVRKGRDYSMLFHIGDILSVMQGATVVPAQRPTLPNGEQPPAWSAIVGFEGHEKSTPTLAATPDIEKALWEHMTGRVLGSVSLRPSDKTEIREALYQEYPWLRDIEVPTTLFRGNGETQAAARTQWLSEIEAKHGSWIAIPMIEQHHEEWKKRIGAHDKSKIDFPNVTKEEAERCAILKHHRMAQIVLALSKLHTPDNRKQQCVISWQDIKLSQDGNRGSQIMIVCKDREQMYLRYDHLVPFFEQAGLEKYIRTGSSPGSNRIYVDAQELEKNSVTKQSPNDDTLMVSVSALDHLADITMGRVVFDMFDPSRRDRGGKRGR